MHILYEAPVGLLLFRIGDADLPTDPKRLIQLVDSGNTDVLKLVARCEFENVSRAAEYISGSMPQDADAGVPEVLRDFLSRELVGRVPASETLLVGTPQLAGALRRDLGVNTTCAAPRIELMRMVREHLSALVAGVRPRDLHAVRRGLAVRRARYVLRISPDQIDALAVRAIRLYDDLEKKINGAAVRVREWYAWHFPELSALVADPLQYARVVLALGRAENAADADALGELLAPDTLRAVQRASLVSIGSSLGDDDLTQIQALAQQVLDLARARAALGTYLAERMGALAPNLTHLVGALVAARLVSHAGALRALARHPASTVQLYGAERALFQALQRGGPTPKYGLLYRTHLVGKAHPRHKGRIARVLAAKLVLAARVDALSEHPALSIGVPARASVLAALERARTEHTHRTTAMAGHAPRGLPRYDHRTARAPSAAQPPSSRPRTYRDHTDAPDSVPVRTPPRRGAGGRPESASVPDATRTVRRITVRKADLIAFAGVTAQDFNALAPEAKKAVARRYVMAQQREPGAPASARTARPAQP